MVRKSTTNNKGELTVTTDLDTYTLKVPTGSLGWKHFRILMEVENERAKTIKEIGPDGKEVILPNPNLNEIMTLAMDKWVETILPNIILSHDFEDIPWSDIFSLFNAVSSNSNIDTTNFRDMEE